MAMTDAQFRELQEAEAIAHEAHALQARKFSNRPYIEHPRAVAELVKHPNQKIVAWLHDVLEDNPHWSTTRLRNRGISDRNIESVIALTRVRGESYYAFIRRIMENGLAPFVKIADITDNLKDLDYSAHRNLCDKYMLALHILKQDVA